MDQKRVDRVAPSAALEQQAARAAALSAASATRDEAPPPTVRTAAIPPSDTGAVATDGAVFGLPRIGFGGTAPTRWITPRGSGMPPAAMPDSARIVQVQLQVQAQSQAQALAAARGHIVNHIERQLADWPNGTGDGACALQAEGAEPLRCDSEPLLQIVSAQSAALAALLGAYRSIDPHVDSLQIAYTHGHYHFRLGSASEVR